MDPEYWRAACGDMKIPDPIITLLVMMIIMNFLLLK